MEETGLLNRVHALIEAPAAGVAAPTLAAMEQTLTDGYARALVMEAERTRLARKIAELAVRAGEDPTKVDELSALAQRVAEVADELARLRRSLSRLRRRAATQRAATAA